MLNEMLEVLSPKDGGVYIDATFGAGGYSRGILEFAASSKVLAIDRDPSVEKFHTGIESHFPGRIIFANERFSRLKEAALSLGFEKVDGVVFDVGVSTMQLSDPERGFSFMKDGPLDMRMGHECGGKSAEVFVNSASEKDIADVIFHYGGERLSRRVARAIIDARKKNRITRTSELAAIVRSVVFRSKANPIDPATRTFQAIRIWVNDELSELKKGLLAAASILNDGGRIVAVSFHSLEDRIAKNTFNELCNQEFSLVNKKVIKPTDREVSVNIRARSAKLRAIERKVAR